MSKEPIIGPGCEVVMHFRITLKSGEVVESTFEDDEPLRFCIGDGMLGSGLEAAIFGLHAGQKQKLDIEAGIAFGEQDPENIHSMVSNDFADKGIDIKPGMVMDFSIPNGESLLGTIVEIDGDNVSVDFNHPLAGRDIVFEVEIVSVELVS